MFLFALWGSSEYVLNAISEYNPSCSISTHIFTLEPTFWGYVHFYKQITVLVKNIIISKVDKSWICV